jgi:hypothetical protein
MGSRRGARQWLSFDIVVIGARTNVWQVSTFDLHLCLGEIKWFARWRGYAFFPAPETAFERGCLREIADFIEAANIEQRERRRAMRRASAKGK